MTWGGLEVSNSITAYLESREYLHVTLVILPSSTPIPTPPRLGSHRPWGTENNVIAQTAPQVLQAVVAGGGADVHGEVMCGGCAWCGPWWRSGRPAVHSSSGCQPPASGGPCVRAWTWAWACVLPVYAQCASVRWHLGAYVRC
jgi:hypothetical protein